MATGKFDSLAVTGNLGIGTGDPQARFDLFGGRVFEASLSAVGCVLLAVMASALLVLGSATQALAATHTCKSVEVYVFPERVHVRCDNAASGGIVFFAVATANSAHAARILSALMMAHLTGRTIVVGYDPNDESGTAFGCQEHDCRRLFFVGVL